MNYVPDPLQWRQPLQEGRVWATYVHVWWPLLHNNRVYLKMVVTLDGPASLPIVAEPLEMDD